VRNPKTLELERCPGLCKLVVGHASGIHISIETFGNIRALLTIQEATRVRNSLDKHIAYLQTKKAKRRKA